MNKITFNNFQLKIIAILLMLIDHIGYFFITNSHYIVFRAIGRLAMPIFLFLFVEGFIKTNNRKKHLIRLILYAGIMLSGNIIFINILPKHYPINTNILFSMLLCFTALCLWELNDNITYKVLAILVGCLTYFTEYGLLTIFLTVIFYCYLKGYLNKISFSLIYIVFCIIYCYFMTPLIQICMIVSLPFMLLYNGKLGYKCKVLQHGFYLFYILHLWLFLLLSNIF